MRHWDQTSVTWVSTTAGDIDGVLLTIDAPDGAILAFDTPTARFSVTLGEIRMRDVRIDAGALDQHVSLSTAGAGTNPRDVAFTFTDHHEAEGEVPYYVTVLQEDGEMAWSSPIFVTCHS